MYAGGRGLHGLDFKGRVVRQNALAMLVALKRKH